jgi:hypothetical protein
MRAGAFAANGHTIAGCVAEEFRERFETMRAPAPVIEGRDIPTSPGPANNRRIPSPER